MCLKLSKWMIKNKLTQYGFAKRYGISQPFLNQVLNGRRRAGLATVRKIEKITGGFVTHKDLRPDLYEVK